MQNVLTSFSKSRLSDSEIIVSGNTVSVNMENNPYFPTPSPGVTAIRTATDEFLAAEQKAQSGSREDVAVKNQKRKVLEKNLHDMAVYVNLTANGNEAMLLSSGFELAKKAEPVGPLAAPEGLKVKPALSKGSVDLSCKRVAGASSYGFEYRLLTGESENGWVRVDSTKHQVLVNGLTSGSKYAFRVVAIGADPQRNWSDEVNSFVL